MSENLASGLGGLTGMDTPIDRETDEDYITHNVAQMHTVRLGRQGEHMTQTVRIDCTAWLAALPGCTLAVAARRPGENSLYLPTISVSGGMITWTVRDQDTALAGCGHAEVRAMVGGKIKKSATFRTLVEPSLEGTGTALPPAAPDWVQIIIDGMEAEKTAGQAAVDAANEAAKARLAADEALHSQTMRLDNLESVTVEKVDVPTPASVIRLPGDVLPFIGILRVIGRTDGDENNPFVSATLARIVARNAAGSDTVLVDVADVVASLFDGEMHSSRAAADEIDLRTGLAVKNTAKVDSTAAMDAFSHSSNTYGGYWLCHILTEPRVRQAADPRVCGTRRVASGSGFPGYTCVRTTQNADYLTLYLADADSGLDGSATAAQAEAAVRAFMAGNGVAIVYALKTPEQVSIDAGAYFDRGDAVELRMVGADGGLVVASVDAAIMRKKAGGGGENDDCQIALGARMPVDAAWAQGGIKSDTGANYSSGVRVCTGFVQNPGTGKRLMITTNGQKASWYQFTSNDVSSYTGVYASISANAVIVPPGGDYFYKIMAMRLDETELTPQDVTVGVCVVSELASEIATLKAALLGVDDLNVVQHDVDEAQYKDAE